MKVERKAVDKEILKALRVDAGLSQGKLAKIIGKSKVHISYCENGHTPLTEFKYQTYKKQIEEWKLKHS